MSSSSASRDAMLAILAEAMEPAGVTITARRMFGEYGLYADGLFFGLICDERLFLKPTDAGRSAMWVPAEDRPFAGAKLWLAPGPDDLDDPDQLQCVVLATLRALA